MWYNLMIVKDVKMRTILKNKIVAVTIFVVGLLMSFLIPTWQTPDEYTHLWMIGDSIGVEEFADNIEDSISIERGRIEANTNEKINIDEQINAMFEKPSYVRSDMMPRSISLGVVKHLPSTLGILIGILLGIPAYWVLQLGEVFSLFFYTAVCYYALEIVPIKKNMLIMIMLFPMTMQQAASINYDAVLLPVCFYFMAYIFYLCYEKDKIGLKEIGVILLLCGVITYIKLPYILFVFLIFFIPLDKIKINIGKVIIDGKLIRKIRIPFLIIGLGMVFVGIYLFRDNWWIQIIYGFVIEWKRGIWLFLETGKTFGKFLMTSTVGTFGWLDTPMNFGIVLIVYTIVAMLSVSEGFYENKKKMEKGRIFISLSTAFILSVFITLSLVNHTIKVILFGSEASNNTYNIREALYQIPYIGGLQGRYYLPFIPLFFVVLPQIIKKNENKIRKSCFGLLFLIYVYVMWLLLKRYWIV